MSRNRHNRHGGDQVFGVITAAQTGYTLMVGHIYGDEGAGISVMLGHETDADPAAIVLDSDTAAEVIGWLQQAVSLTRECAAPPDLN